jgi:hypothetical protein
MKYGEKRMLIHCGWKCKLAATMETIRRLFKS